MDENVQKLIAWAVGVITAVLTMLAMAYKGADKFVKDRLQPLSDKVDQMERNHNQAQQDLNVRIENVHKDVREIRNVLLNPRTEGRRDYDQRGGE